LTTLYGLGAITPLKIPRYPDKFAQCGTAQRKEEPVLRIILVRHGQTDWNDGGSGGPIFEAGSTLR
jgi:hypothetical protein